MGYLSWETAHVASLFPAADPKNAAACFFLPANSHPCSLLQARQSPPIHARKPFSGTFSWMAAAGRLCHPGLCVPGPGAGRDSSRRPQPTAANTAVLPTCAHHGRFCWWLHAGWSCAVFFPGAGWKECMCWPPDSRPGHGGHRSLCPSEAPSQASAGWMLLKFFQIKKIQFKLCVSVVPEQHNLGPQGETHFSLAGESASYPLAEPLPWNVPGHKAPSSAYPQFSSPRCLFVLFHMHMNEEINGKHQHHKTTVNIFAWWLHSSGKHISKYSHRL